MKHTAFQDFSNTFVFDTHTPGPTTTILGGIHGDEIAGVQTIEYLIDQIENEVFKLLNGKLILAYGNEQAIEADTRGIHHNMNRLFQEKYLSSDSNEYEIQRAQQLAQIMKQTDYLLDIHSTSSSTAPFIFAEDIGNELKLANSIFLGKTILGWEAMADGSVIGGDTNGFTHKHGGIALTLEGGSHKDESTLKVSKDVSLSLLGFLGMIENISEEHHNGGETYKMYKIQTSKHADIEFSKNFHNFDQIQAGDFLYTDGGEKIFAEEDFTILLPNCSENIEAGKEIFYYGRKI